MKMTILEKIQHYFEANTPLLKTLLIFSFFVSFFLHASLLNVVLEFKPLINDFSKHVISNAAFNDFDISQRIKYYYWIYSSLFFFTLLLAALFFSYLKNRFVQSDEKSKTLNVVQNISYIGIASVFTSLFFINVDLSSFFICFLGFYLLISTTKRTPHWSYNNAYWILVIAIPFSVLAYFIINIKNLNEIKISNIFLPVSTNLLFFYISFVTITLLLHFFLKWFFKNNSQEEILITKANRLYLSTFPISSIIIVLSIFLEGFNVINLRTGYVFNSPKLLFVFLSIVAVIISVFIYKFLVKKDSLKKIDYNPIVKYHFLLLVLSLAFMFTQPWRMFEPENEFFEFANHGLSVDHFFRYGSIPIVETFDAHMMYNQLFAYVYGFVSGYEPWAPFLYMSYNYIFVYLISYLIFKNILGPLNSLLLVVCFPMLGAINSEFIYCGFVALMLLQLFKKEEKIYYYGFWFSIISMIIFRLDLGFASLLSGIISWILLMWFLKRPFQFKLIFQSAAVSFGSVLLLFLIICVAKGINPVGRLFEFLTISMSNQNWAYEDLGDTNHIVFRISYYILPLITLGLLAQVIAKMFLTKDFYKDFINNKISLAALVFFIFFTLFFYFNIPRGIVRHSFLFNKIKIILSIMPLALLCFTLIYSRKNNLIYFLTIFIGIYFLVNLNQDTFKGIESSFFSKAIASPSFNEKFSNSSPFEGTRVRETHDFSDAKYFKQVLDNLLKEGETYFDFSSTNYYYALTGRKNPLYVNQSPLLLNGDDSQKMTLEQLKKVKVPLVLIPNSENIWNSVDGVHVDYKYYLLSEYIYKNYSPLLKMQGFTIYAQHKRKSEFENKLTKIGDKGQISNTSFSNIDVNNLDKNDISVVSNNGELILTDTGDDPFITGILNQFKLFDSFSQNTPKTLKIKIDALSLGSVQVFYTLPNQDSFTEESSKRFTISTIGVQELELNLPSYIKDLRIDIDLPKMIVKDISVKKETEKQSLVPEFLSYNLGEIPKVWGEKADQELFEKVKKLDELAYQTALVLPVNLTKHKPYYLFMELDSNIDQNFRVEMFDNKSNKKAEYAFKGTKGKHKYAIRLSSNYYWWNNTISKITFKAEKTVAFSKFALISEDGLSQFLAITNDLYLSNITDQNWQGGVGTSFNKLLMDNSDSNMSALKRGNKIELSNKRKIEVINYYIVGDFIHVETNEQVGTFKSDISYPKSFKIVK